MAQASFQVLGNTLVNQTVLTLVRFMFFWNRDGHTSMNQYDSQEFLKITVETTVPSEKGNLGFWYMFWS